MLQTFIHFGDSSSGLGALGFDGQAFLIQLITFILAYLVLRRFAFQPIIRMLRDRRTLIESGVKLGEEMKKERAALEEQIEKKLHDTRRAADDIIAEAEEAARQAIRDGEEKAKQKAVGILSEAESRIAQDTTRARKQLEKEVVGLIADTTEVILGEKVDTKKDSELIDRALKERQAVKVS